jgi:hypothetical protein
MADKGIGDGVAIEIHDGVGKVRPLIRFDPWLNVAASAKQQ